MEVRQKIKTNPWYKNTDGFDSGRSRIALLRLAALLLIGVVTLRLFVAPSQNLQGLAVPRSLKPVCVLGLYQFSYAVKKAHGRGSQVIA